jgi:hypothetical protein
MGKLNHLQGSGGGFNTFIAVFAPCTIQGLLFIVGC